MNAFQRCLANAEVEIARKRNAPDAGWWKDAALWQDEYDPDRKLETLAFFQVRQSIPTPDNRPLIIPVRPLTDCHTLRLVEIHARQNLRLMWIPQVGGRGQPVRVLAKLGT